jgi:hypothetical protein
MAYWQRFRARQRAIEKAYIDDVHRELRRQFNAFIIAIREGGFEYARLNINNVVNPKGITAVLKRMYKAAILMEGNYIFNGIVNNRLTLKAVTERPAFGVGFEDLGNLVDDYFNIYLIDKSALPITQTTKRIIRDKLINDVDNGKPLEEAIKDFRQLALTSGPHRDHAISVARAKNIIATESIRAMSFGELIGAYMTGTDLDKVWVTCDDEKVRRRPYSHRVLDRQTASLFGTFSNGEPIKFPGDPDASLENTANCRCTMFFKRKNRQPAQERSIGNFLTDFFAGFMIGNLATNEIFGE